MFINLPKFIITPEIYFFKFIYQHAVLPVNVPLDFHQGLVDLLNADRIYLYAEIINKNNSFDDKRKYAK